MKKVLSALRSTPRTHEELAFRTHLRIGAMVIVGLLLFLAIKFWFITILVVLGGVAWLVAKKMR
jgi:hypothetical protein